MADGTNPGIDVRIKSTVLPAEQIDNMRRLVVEKSWSAADRAELEFRDDDLETTYRVGDPIEIKMAAHHETTLVQVFAGDIVGIGLRYTDGIGYVTIEALDARHKLTRTIEPKTYENVKLDDIVRNIAGAHGLSVEGSLGNTVFEHFIVADSHFAVLQYAARRSGTVWTLTDSKLKFSDPGTADGSTAELEAGTDLIDIDLRFAPIEQAKEVAVNGWDQSQGKAIVGKVTSTKPIHEIGFPKNTVSEDLEVAWGGGAHDVKDAQEVATGIERRLRSADVIGTGSAELRPDLVPGRKVKLKNIGTLFNGDYVLSSVVHRFGDLDGTGSTDFRVGPPDASLDQLLGDGERQGGRAPNGITIGTVTDTDDPKKLGRVRVKLPLISDQLQTGWVRTSSLGSGKDRGIVFVPEINDEVVVAFEHGELNRPYVLGGLWNDVGTAFEGATKGNQTDERRLVSKLGSAVRFIDVGSDDETSGIAIEMDDAKTRIFMGYKQVTIETEGRPLEIKNGKASIKMENDDIT
ncbi:MAG: phage baseplate assembly protein V, partial [Ilumatobacter fluminis]